VELQLQVENLQKLKICFRLFIGVGADKFCGVGAKKFCPNFPKLARNVFGPLFVSISSHTQNRRKDPRMRSGRQKGGATEI